MNRDEIIKLTYLVGAKRLQEKNSDTEFLMSQEQLEHLVALVAVDYERRLKFTAERWEIECQSQVEIEREACAELCSDIDGGENMFSRAIRARGQS